MYIDGHYLPDSHRRAFLGSGLGSGRLARVDRLLVRLEDGHREELLRYRLALHPLVRRAVTGLLAPLRSTWDALCAPMKFRRIRFDDLLSWLRGERPDVSQPTLERSAAALASTLVGLGALDRPGRARIWEPAGWSPSVEAFLFSLALEFRVRRWRSRPTGQVCTASLARCLPWLPPARAEELLHQGAARGLVRMVKVRRGERLRWAVQRPELEILDRLQVQGIGGDTAPPP